MHPISVNRGYITDEFVCRVPLFLPKQHPDGKWRVVSITHLQCLSNHHERLLNLTDHVFTDVRDDRCSELGPYK